MSILETRLTAWPDEAACRVDARNLAARPGLRDAYVELRGTLGAGKTTFTRHLLHALGVVGRVKSPTYTVVEPYEPPGLPVWHFDFYRFDDPQEWEDAGFRDLFASVGLKIAEWPEKAEGLLPVPDLVIEIAIPVHDDDDDAEANDERRSVGWTAMTPRGQGLLP